MRRLGTIAAMATLVLLVAATGRGLGVRAQDELSSEESSYVGQMLMAGNLLGTSMGNFSNLVSDPNVEDAEWVQELVGHALLWQAVNREVRDIDDVPSRFDEVHERYLEIFALTADAGDDLIVGTRTFDVDLINSANEKIAEGASMMGDMPDLLAEARNE